MMNDKNTDTARGQREARKALEDQGLKVVVQNGFFSVAPLSYEGAPEAHASRNERLKRAGLEGGLSKVFARRLASRLQAARDRRRGRRRA